MSSERCATGRPRRILVPNECRASKARIPRATECAAELIPDVRSTPSTHDAAAYAAFSDAFGSHLGLRVTALRATRRAAQQRAAEPFDVPSSYGTSDPHGLLQTQRVNPAPSEGAHPSLDYSGTTDPQLENELERECPDDPMVRACFLDAADEGETRAGVPLSYLSEVERETEAHRIARSRAHAAAAALAARGLRESGLHPDRELEAIAPRIPVRDGGMTKAERRELAGRGIVARARGHADRVAQAAASERSVRWHEGRARGALERFSRVIDCGKKRVLVHCNACGSMHDVPDRCACPRLCLACREGSRRQRIARLDEARSRVLEAAKRRGLLNRYRKGGAWGERMVTLTIPHVRADRWEEESRGEGASVRTRVDALFSAWRAFANRLNKWARELPGHGSIEWYRAFEWTPGHDGEGHPHFHIWLFSPFLPVQTVRRWWRLALAAEGIFVEDSRCNFVRAASYRSRLCARAPRSSTGCAQPKNYVRARFWFGFCSSSSSSSCSRGRPRYRRTCPHVADVIVDVRAGDDQLELEAAKGAIKLRGADGERITRYIEGWSIVDATNGGRVPPAIIARLYEALEARRLVQPSAHLLKQSRTGCSDCGAVGWTRVELLDPGLRVFRVDSTCRNLQAPARSPP